jgi:homoserine dehydrogenase
MPLVEHLPVGAPVEARRSRATDLRVGLLGLGRVGSAVARLANETSIRIEAALVRDPRSRRRVDDVPLTTRADAILDSRPDVIVEVLGGLEPARTIVLRAINRGIPVVTANKSLLAHHGDEIIDAADAAGVPLCYEASVIAGVPFLETFARRPLAARITSLTGIVNGTTNYILSRLAAGAGDYRAALCEAQRLGYAEPDPSSDVRGVDAAEKLIVLLRQFAARSIQIADVETIGITALTSADCVHAAALGGTIKPIVHADWSSGALSAFAGPAFVPSTHPLAAVHGSANGILLRDCRRQTIGLTGPGAGPESTAITILDDVRQAAEGRTTPATVRRRGWFELPETSWLVRLAGANLTGEREIENAFVSRGVGIVRTSSRPRDDHAQWLLTYPAERPRIEAAARALTAAACCSISCIRALATPEL